MPRIALERLYHANVVVEDLRAAACNYARILGIAGWDVHHWSPDRLRDTQAFGYRAELGYATATGANSQGITFRLVQPMHGFSTFAEHLITRGQSVHSLSLSTGDADISVAQAATHASGARSVMLDTRRALGGFYVELSQGTQPAPDEHWDLSVEAVLPDDVRWLSEIPKIGHFGMAVSSVAEKLPHYAELLGVEHWSGAHFNSAPGMLKHSTFRGAEVDNAWFLAITDVANFGLELLQETRGPTDYRATVDRIGEGVHHVLVRRDLSEADWIALRDWMASMAIGTVMSGQVRGGAAEFFYLDTRDALGFLLEVIVAHDIPAGGTPMRRFDLDFSRHA
jgi:hypothetical protein